MREILFRGKRVDNGEWAEGYLWIGNDFLCITPHNVGISYDEKAKRVIAFAHEVDRKTVCQYTGLTDKNGRKIFEGDILEFTDCELGKENYTVFWNQVEWGIRSELGNMDDLRVWDSSNWKIIGNIFDNPELLKGDKE